MSKGLPMASAVERHNVYRIIITCCIKALYFKIKMGQLLASYMLPSIMSYTQIIVSGVGSFHGPLTQFVSRIAQKGVLYTLTLLF